jgi:hypothetical protein
MGIVPGSTSGWAVIGVHERTIYRDSPGKISYFTVGQVTGGYSNQVVSLMRTAAGYHPLIIVVESFDTRNQERLSSEFGQDLGPDLSPVCIAARIQFCIDTHYILAPIEYQTSAMALNSAPYRQLKAWGLYKPGPYHIQDATSHAITFIRRANENTRAGTVLRDKAWGPEENHIVTHNTPRNQARRINARARGNTSGHRTRDAGTPRRPR